MTSVSVARTSTTATWSRVLGVGLLGGVSALYLCLVGIVPTFESRPLIVGVLALGEAFVLGTMLITGYVAAVRADGRAALELSAGAVAGLITGATLSALMLIAPAVGLRSIFLHASDELWNVLTFGRGLDAWWIPTVTGLIVGTLGAALRLLPRSVRNSIAIGLLSVVALGLFAGLIRTPLLASPYAALGRLLFAPEGLTLVGTAVTLSTALGAGIGAAVGPRFGSSRGAMVGGVAGGLIFSIGGALIGDGLASGVQVPRASLALIGAAIGGAIGIVAGTFLGATVGRSLVRRRVPERYAELTGRRARLVRLLLLTPLLLLVLVLPFGAGPTFANVVVLVAIYILMGLGLNITLGLAGLLDLGFVAFFAVGAYTMGLLTATGELGIAHLTFWQALPFAVLVAFLFGVVLGLPILGIRGDYLAIATLGFGEIIRILSVSDLLRPWLGGPQGITAIPKPFDVPPGSPFAGPVQIYYIVLVCAAIVAFIAYRLRDSRLGRAWLAIREDEDVAEAIGVHLVQTKLLAYALGAAFAGLSGAVSASLVSAVFPTSIDLFVSINVAAIVIVGGMGSIPGVVVGAIFLIGLPELFREFSEYRLLFYGAALIIVMRFRPEGLVPSRIARRELHVTQENVDIPGAAPGEHVAAAEGV